jgi:hypothetical protein
MRWRRIEIRLIGILSHKPKNFGIAFCDIIMRFFFWLGWLMEQEVGTVYESLKAFAGFV